MVAKVSQCPAHSSFFKSISLGLGGVEKGKRDGTEWGWGGRHDTIRDGIR